VIVARTSRFLSDTIAVGQIVKEREYIESTPFLMVGLLPFE